jgi:Arc/MetJ-type ribon-helix-helix transcriptional regulator
VPYPFTILSYGVNYGTDYGHDEAHVAVAKKITVDVPEDLLREAQAQTGEGISETVRRGLQLLAAAQAFRDVRSLRGKVKFSKTITELKDDEP